jgi:hypothetical protein
MMTDDTITRRILNHQSSTTNHLSSSTNQPSINQNFLSLALPFNDDDCTAHTPRKMNWTQTQTTQAAVHTRHNPIVEHGQPHASNKRNNQN